MRKKKNEFFIILYLIILNTLINCSTIYPDHYSKYDQSFSSSNSNLQLIYKNGYFTESNEILKSPKYGLYYEPDKTCKTLSTPLTYNSNDEISFFSNSQFIISKSSTKNENENISEEVNIYKHTLKGEQIKCEAPFPFLQNTNYKLKYKIAIINNNNQFIIKIESNESSNIVFNINNTPSKYKLIEIDIEKYNSNKLKFGYEGNYQNLSGEKFNIIFKTSSELIISNYRITLQDSIINPSYTFNGNPDCDNSNNPCLNNYICNGGKCVECHSSCLKCLNLEYNKCTLCNYLTPYSGFNDGICKIGYIDLNKFNNFNINIQPINTGRLTFGFWIYISNILNDDNNIFHVTIEDFINISILIENNIINAYCIPHENLFKNLKEQSLITNFASLINDKLDDLIFIEIPNSEQEPKDLKGHWFFISCAMSYDNGLYYMKSVINGISNYKIKTLPKEHLFIKKNGGEKIYYDNDIYYRRIYSNNEKMKIYFNNFLNFKNTNIYLRNVILFKEYMQPDFNYMYYNFYNISVNDFPEILYIIPFDDLIKTYSKFYIKGKNPSFLIEDTFEISIKDPLIDPNIPPLNFKHLNLNKPNENFNEIDTNPNNIHSIENINLNARFLYEVNSPLKCNDNFFYDLESKKCENSCVLNKIKYTHYPGISDKSGYCDYFCDNNMICDLNLKTTNEGFCNLDINPNIFNLFYTCKNNENNYYLQFSRFYNSQPIKITNLNLHSYIIEFWYYPDLFLIYNSDQTYFNYLSKSYFFSSNTIQGYFIGEKVFFENYSDQNDPIDVTSYYFKREWNKFILYVELKEDKFYYFKIYINNHPGLDLKKVSTDSFGQLKEIIFCNNCILNLKTIFWSHGFYKNLKIWDGSKSSYLQSIQFNNFYSNDEFLNINSIYYFYPLKNEYIQDNNICDFKKLNCINLNNNNYDIFHFQKYNFGSKFDSIENIYPSLGKFLNSSDEVSHEDLLDKILNCSKGCSRCWDNKFNFCYECYSDYFLYNNECKKKEKFYFKSPMDNIYKKDVSIFISFPLNTNSITCNFWVKPFDFSSDKGILIKYSNNLDLIYYSDETNSNYGLNLRFLGNIISNYKYFREKLGKWTFFSIAYHYSKNETNEYFPQMLIFQIDDISFEINYNNLVEKIELNRFTIPKTFYGLFYNLKYYLDFIIGSYGIELNIGIPKPPFNLPNYYDQIYFPVGSNEKNCYLENYFEENTLLFSCVADYEIKFENKINDYTKFYKNPNDETNNDCNNECFQCFKKGDNGCLCSNKNYNSHIILKNKNNHYCKKSDFINFANSDPIIINNVKTAKSSKSYTMQFWMFAYNYKKGKFGGVTFHWNGHNKILIFKNDSLEDNNYIFKCVSFEKINGEKSKDELNLNIEINKWNFISCGVDLVNMKMSINLITEIDKFYLNSNISDFNYPDIILNNEYTTLSIIDNSKILDWGLLFFRYIKLWKYYYSNSEFISRIKNKNTNLFPNLLNIWEPKFTKELEFYDGFIVKDESTPNSKNADNFIVKHNENLGINILDDFVYTNLVLCEEQGQFYDGITNTCLNFPTITNRKDFYFENIIPSFSGNYAMAFWIFIEDSAILTTGIHIRWEKHLQISILKSNSLEGFCFPQGYYSDNLSNKDINEKYSNSLNKARVKLNKNNENESGNWIFVICSVSNYMEKFYINGNDEELLNENEMIKESLYISESTNEIQNSYPFRYFQSNLTNSQKIQYTKLYLENIKNTKKIYFRIIELFRDYIPYHYNFKYIDLSLLKANDMPSLIFACNFANFNFNTKKLKYSLYDLNTKAQNYKKVEKEVLLNLISSTSTNELSGNFLFLPLCNTYSSHKYDENTNSCKLINSCLETELNAFYCLDENEPFICHNHFTINIDENNYKSYCKETCDYKKMRNPGTQEKNGICNSEISDFLIGNLNSINEIENYKTSFSCSSGYQLINYKCIENKRIENSAIFFNRCYNQPNFYKTITNDHKNKIIIKGYFIEFWFKIDNICNFCAIPKKNNNIEMENLYYFYSKPHTIYNNPNNNLWYYQLNDNEIIDKFQIENINQYEWNKIVIETKMKEKEIILYINFEISDPQIPKIINNNIKLNIDKLLLNYISFCSFQNNGKCIPNQDTSFKISWGSAFYKNLRLWDSMSSTIESIQKYDRSNELLSSLLLYYPMTIDKITFNIIQNVIDDSNNIILSHSPSFNFDSNDDFLFYNYGINFDWNEESIQNYGYYITKMKNNEIFSSKCHNYCKRCYSILENNCYECKDGYFLNEQTCYKMTGYFLTTPPHNSQSYITFKLSDTTDLKINEMKSYTISFFMKIKGIVDSYNNEPVILLLKQDIFIVYERTTSNLIFYINNQPAFLYENFSKLFGIWILISISNYASKTYYNIYPSMISFMIDKISLPKLSSFTLSDYGMSIEEISFGYEIFSLYSSLRIYNTFIHGVYGKIKAGEENRENGVILHYELYNFGNNIKCVNQYQLKNSLDINCEKDYNPYLNLEIECNDESLYFDLNIKDNKKPCKSCFKDCKTFCFKENQNECTCDLTNGLFWLREKKDIINSNDITQTYCENIHSIDFSILNDINIIVPSSVTKESTLEFWFYIYYYQSMNSFNMINIEWDLHNKIQINNLNNVDNELYVKCFPLYSIDDSNLFTESISLTIESKKWIYLSCGSNLLLKKKFLNNDESDLSTNENIFPNRDYKTNLKIYSNIKNYNFGFVFLREIKLWQQYNFNHVKSSHISLLSFGNYDEIEKKTNGKYPGLISYIKANLDLKYYKEIMKGNYYIINLIGEDNQPGEYNKIYPYTNIIKRKENEYIGYNIVNDDFKDIPLCEEKNVYNDLNENCEIGEKNILDNLKCQFLGDSNNCISCLDESQFLNINNGECVENCPETFYNNIYINQCRNCYKNCLKCYNEEKNQCISCIDNYYYVKSKKECVEDCSIYGLTMSSIEPFTCIEFEAIVNLKNEIPIDLRTFQQINAEIIYITSNDYSLKWRFDKEETMKLNNENEYFTFLYDSPFQNDNLINELNVNIKNDFFEIGKSYVFYLDVISSESYNIVIPFKFIIPINKSPYGGIFNVIPKKGLYTTTNFVIYAYDWIDDLTKDLEYKFYYSEKGKNSIFLLQDFNSNNEIINNNWEGIFQKEMVEVIIYLEVKDNYDAITKEEIEIQLYNNLTNDKYDISIELENFSIPLNYDNKVLYHRSELLKSLVLNSYKNFQSEIERTIFISSSENSLLIKKDPYCINDYCNIGICDLIDIYLVCYCDFNYLGKNCQVNRRAYYQLLNLYDYLFKLILSNIKNNIEDIQLKSIYNLFDGAWQFIQKDSFFTDNFNLIIDLSMKHFPDFIIKNLDMYFDLFGFYFSHEFLMINQDKISYKNSLRYEFRNVSLDDYSAVHYKNTINELKNYMINFITFVTSTKKISNFEYDSFNFYITIQKINSDFDEDNFFRKRKIDYKSYIKFMKCIHYFGVNVLNNPNYEFYMVFIEYYNFPYLYNSTIYTNNTSPLIDIFFLDNQKFNEINLNNCNNEQNIIIYLPFNSYKFLEQLNSQKWLFDPNNYKSPSDPFFKDPIYIEKNGFISNDSIEDRIKLYNRFYNFSCRYFYEEKFIEQNIIYNNLTDNYIEFKTNHLSEFTTFFIENNATFIVSNRFFYLKKIQIIKYFPNYTHNYAFYFLGIFFLLYIFLIIILNIYDYNIIVKDSLLNFLKIEIVKGILLYNNRGEEKINEIIPNDFQPGINILNNEKGKSNVEIDYNQIDKGKEKEDFIKFHGIEDFVESKTIEKKITNIKKINIQKKNDYIKEDESSEIRRINNDKLFIINDDLNSDRITKTQKDFSQNEILRNIENKINFQNEDYRNNKDDKIILFRDIPFSTKKFIKINIRRRNTCFNALLNISIFNPRWKKITLLLTEINLISLFVSLLLTNNEKITEKSFFKCCLTSFFSFLISNFVIYFLNIFFYFSYNQRKTLYDLIINRKQLIILREYEKIKKHNKIFYFFGFIIVILIWIFSFYCSIGFVAVWKIQKNAYLICILLNFFFHFIISDIFVELFIGLLYKYRKEEYFSNIGEFFNNLRNYRCLYP